MWNWLKGKKTYIVAAGTAIGAAAQYWQGAIGLDTLNLALVGAASTAGVRHGITTSSLALAETMAALVIARATPSAIAKDPTQKS